MEQEYIVCKINSQIYRLNKSLITTQLRTCVDLNNSSIVDEIDKVYQNIKKQTLIFANLKATNFVNEFQSVLKKNSQNEKVNKIICERNALIAELKNLDDDLLLANQKKKDILQKLNEMIKESIVLDDLLRSEDNNE